MLFIILYDIIAQTCHYQLTASAQAPGNPVAPSFESTARELSSQPASFHLPGEEQRHGALVQILEQFKQLKLLYKLKV